MKSYKSKGFYCSRARHNSQINPLIKISGNITPYKRVIKYIILKLDWKNSAVQKEYGLFGRDWEQTLRKAQVYLLDPLSPVTALDSTTITACRNSLSHKCAHLWLFERNALPGTNDDPKGGTISKIGTCNSQWEVNVQAKTKESLSLTTKITQWSPM